MKLPLYSLSGQLGKRISRISRVLFFPPDGSVPTDDGALEIEFEGEALLLDGAGDGESLTLSAGPWEDPFRPPLSDENERYLRESGRWCRVDCSESARFCDLLGRELVDVKPLKNAWGRIAGVRLSVERSSLWFVVDGDECQVYWAHPIGFTEELFDLP